MALDLGASIYFLVNRTGTALWSLLEAGTTMDEMVKTLMELYQLSADEASRDVEAFVAELDERAFLEPLGA